jgi:segregation and condensation protein B
MFRLASQIEAILYLKGQPLDLAAIAECALEVVENPMGYTLQLRDSFQPLIDKIVPAEIGTGALRTLAAIAIKGSISQSELVELRGSGAYQHVQELVEVGFIRKRRQAGSRSALLQVTDKFNRTYELNDLPLPAAVQKPPQLQQELEFSPPNESVSEIEVAKVIESADFPTESNKSIHSPELAN